MKKYEKPKILFENLEFNTAIAACQWVIVNGCKDETPNNGLFETPFKTINEIDGSIMTYFTRGENSICTTEGMCYHIPEATEFSNGHDTLS